MIEMNYIPPRSVCGALLLRKDDFGEPHICMFYPRFYSPSRNRWACGHHRKTRLTIHLDECSVCLCDIKRSQEIILPCRHIFHKRCVKRWFNRGQRSCPLCRRIIPLHNDHATLHVDPSANIHTVTPMGPVGVFVCFFGLMSVFINIIWR
jgi:hypothetical protein